jgi:single-strand DNA-binding protein
MSENLHIIIGNVGRDAEVKHTQGGQAVANFSVATSKRWKDKAGEWQEKTSWHNIVVWGAQAERCSERVKKGAQVYVRGSVETRKWTGKDGQERTTTETVADEVRVLGPRERDAGKPTGAAPPTPGAAESDDLPF